MDIRRPEWFFTLIFAFAFMCQLALWHIDTFTDHQIWLTRLTHMHHDLQHPTDFDQKHYSSHPGTATLVLGSIFHSLGLSIEESLIMSVSSLIALAVATLATLCRLLRPFSWWWIVAASLVLFEPLYLKASPTNAVASPLLASIVIYCLWLYTSSWKRIPQHHQFFLGSLIGIALATRLPITAALTAPFLMMFAWRFRFKDAVLTGAFSLVVMIILVPLLWYIPLPYVNYLRWSVDFHMNQDAYSLPLTPSSFILFAPLSLLSFALGIIILIFPLRKLFFIPPAFLILLQGVTILLACIFLTSKTQSLRYFSPLFFLWEALLPAFVFFLLQEASIKRRLPSRPVPHWQMATSAVLVISQLFMLVYLLLPPL